MEELVVNDVLGGMVNRDGSSSEDDDEVDVVKVELVGGLLSIDCRWAMIVSFTFRLSCIKALISSSV
jgi:hypothetical protein